MNGTQQQERRTAILDLDRKIDKGLEDLAAALDGELKKSGAIILNKLDIERVKLEEKIDHTYSVTQELQPWVNSLGSQQRTYVDDQIHMLNLRLYNFERLHNTPGWRGIWMRLRWNFMGAF
jgi:CII-binding regulator of phage lambda lysogenization HflD